jgi:hypothetical protein
MCIDVPATAYVLINCEYALGRVAVKSADQDDLFISYLTLVLPMSNEYNTF